MSIPHLTLNNGFSTFDKNTNFLSWDSVSWFDSYLFLPSHFLIAWRSLPANLDRLKLNYVSSLNTVFSPTPTCFSKCSYLPVLPYLNQLIKILQNRSETSLFGKFFFTTESACQPPFGLPWSIPFLQCLSCMVHNSFIQQ